jgi:putative aldouronate transport system substrate-binding protein
VKADPKKKISHADAARSSVERGKMKKGISRSLAVALSAAMAGSLLTACGGGAAATGASSGTAATEAGASESTSAEAAKADSTAADNGDIVTLKWVTVGSGMPENYDAWQKNINEYLAEKIGVNIDMEVVSWGDWTDRRSIITNTNEDYDILFTNSDTYTSDVKLGAFLDLTDLLQKDAPDLYKMIPEDYWKACQVDGKVYAVPTYKDSSSTQYFVWDKTLTDKYSIDATKLTTLDSLTDALTKIKDGEKSTPFELSSSSDMTSIFTPYDALSSGLYPLGVKMDDQSHKVVSVLEQDDIMSELKTLHQWYKDGIINQDAATLAETPAYRSCFVAQGWSGAAKTTWGPQMGVEAQAVQWGNTVMSNDTVRGSLNCISAGCKHPDKALAFLQLINTDSKVRDAFYYGLEGDNFEYTSDGKVKKLNDDWTMAGYTQGTFFNVSQLADADFNQWDEVKQLNADATPSVMLGFTLDTSEFEDELANCIEIYNRYKSELLTGTSDPETEVPALMKELRDAGFDDIMQKTQTQVDAYFAK